MAIFVTIATVKIKRIGDFYTLAIVLITYKKKLVKTIFIFEPHRGGGALLSYALEIWSGVVGTKGGCLGFLHIPTIDCCNVQLQIPKRDILLTFEHKRDISYLYS